VIAVSSRDANDAAMTKKALEIDFPLLPGPNFPIQKKYGVYNYKTNLANAAMFIVAKDGVIRWRYIGRDQEDRPDIATVVEQVQKLAQ